MSNRRQERDLQQAMGKMNMGDMLKAAEQNDFRVLTLIGFLNKLAMLSTQEQPFFMLSKVSDDPDAYTDEELAELTSKHIVVHDNAAVSENDVCSYPVVTSVCKGEDGKLVVEYADTAFGGTITHFRAVDDDGELFLTVFCEGANRTIIVADGEWFTA